MYILCTLAVLRHVPWGKPMTGWGYLNILGYFDNRQQWLYSVCFDNNDNRDKTEKRKAHSELYSI